MVFVPKPVEYLSGSEGFPSSPLLKPANPLHEREPISSFLTGSRTGPTIPKDLNQLPKKSLSPDPHSTSVNGALRETVHRQSPLMRNAPRESTRTSSEDGLDAFPKLVYRPLPPIPFPEPPPLATMQRVYARTATSRTYPFPSTAASVYSNWVASTLYTPHTPALNPGFKRFQSLCVPSAFSELEGPPLIGSLSLDAATTPKAFHFIQHSGRGTAHPPDTSAVEQRSFPRTRTGSDGQVIDLMQWRRLVLSAAAGPQ